MRIINHEDAKSRDLYQKLRGLPAGQSLRVSRLSDAAYDRLRLIAWREDMQLQRFCDGNITTLVMKPKAVRAGKPRSKPLETLTPEDEAARFAGAVNLYCHRRAQSVPSWSAILAIARRLGWQRVGPDQFREWLDAGAAL